MHRMVMYVCNDGGAVDVPGGGRSGSGSSDDEGISLAG